MLLLARRRGVYGDRSATAPRGASGRFAYAAKKCGRRLTCGHYENAVTHCKQYTTLPWSSHTYQNTC